MIGYESERVLGTEMLEGIPIEPAGAADLSEILALLERSDLPREGLKDHLSTVLVARLGRKVVGSVALEVYGTLTLLRSLAVESDLRGKGLGRRLTQAALAQVRKQGGVSGLPTHGDGKRLFPPFWLPSYFEISGCTGGPSLC